MNRKYLTYTSLEAWAIGESLPKDWTKHPDEKQRKKWWKQFINLKQHLWSKHLLSLTNEEKIAFDSGTHPSLSHEYEGRALPFTQLLKCELADIGYNADVALGFYHMDRIVLCATLDKTPPDGLLSVPWLFRGFEVKYSFPDANNRG